MAAAEAGDPTAFVALASIVSDLRRVHERLERTAHAAENDNQRLAVASLSAQQLRASEVRAKIGGVGSYAGPKTAGTTAPMFNLVMNFSGGQRVEIGGTPVDPASVPDIGTAPRTIEAMKLPTMEPAVDVPDLLESADYEDTEFNDDA